MYQEVRTVFNKLKIKKNQENDDQTMKHSTMVLKYLIHSNTDKTTFLTKCSFLTVWCDHNNVQNYNYFNQYNTLHKEFGQTQQARENIQTAVAILTQTH